MQKQELTIKQQQKLSPLQIQTIKLIELPVQELEQRIRKELEENPVLDDSPQEKSDDTEDDEPRDVSLSEIKEDDSTPYYLLKINNYGKDERPQYSTFSVKQSFTQSLMEQLGFRDITEHERQIATFIIGSLGEDGYLRRDIDSLVDDLAFRAGIETDEEEVERLLHMIQEFDPPGVGARNLQECLLLQLKVMNQTEDVLLAERILTEQFNEFSNRHYRRVMAKLGITEEQMKQAVSKIVHLNPSPGGQIDDSDADRALQIVPDFRLDYEEGEFKLTMPRLSVPDIRVNQSYARILEDAASTDKSNQKAAQFVKSKVDSAKWFVEAIKQRHNTLNTTMKAILDYQKEFFMTGDDAALKPMVLKDIAEKTGFDISTISRVVNSKYIETTFGIYPLKYFFSEGLENQAGEEVSTRELKKVVQECIEAEDKQHPLTDDQLTTEMKNRGYRVARRTIAKYREQLGIPKARLRKEI